MGEIICQKCRRREAVFLRPFSGEKLCLQCLRDVVYKRVKRVLSKSSLLSPGMNVGLVAFPFFLNESLVAHVFLSEIERKYRSRLSIILFEGEWREAFLSRAPPIVGETIVVRDWERMLKCGKCSTQHYYRGLRGFALRKAREYGVQVLLSPACHEYLVLLELSSLLSSRIDGLGESRISSRLGDSGMGWINVFHGVSCMETSLLGYTMDRDFYLYSLEQAGRFAWDPYDRASWKIIGGSLGMRSGEMMFSLMRTLDWIALPTLSPYSCEWCGGPSQKKGTCSYCSELPIHGQSSIKSG